jgi:hypothetical protein
MLFPTLAPSPLELLQTCHIRLCGTGVASRGTIWAQSTLGYWLNLDFRAEFFNERPSSISKER